MKLHEYVIQPFKKERKGAVILLPGRDTFISNMIFYYSVVSKLWNTMYLAFDPDKEWYPQPWGPDDQEDAVRGLRKSVHVLDQRIKEAENKLKLKRSEIALVGYSAGAVMALQVNAYSKNPFAAVIVHSGAILEPDNLPVCKHQETKILLTHGSEDICFDYYERYLPMKRALKRNGYNLAVEERGGDHRMNSDDIKASSFLLKEIFNYEKTP